VLVVLFEEELSLKLCSESGSAWIFVCSDCLVLGAGSSENFSNLIGPMTLSFPLIVRLCLM
jgi:hypothetical protein